MGSPTGCGTAVAAGELWSVGRVMELQAQAKQAALSLSRRHFNARDPAEVREILLLPRLVACCCCRRLCRSTHPRRGHRRLTPAHEDAARASRPAAFQPARGSQPPVNVHLLLLLTLFLPRQPVIRSTGDRFSRAARMFKITMPQLAVYEAPPSPPSTFASLGMDVDGLSDHADAEHDEENGIDLEEGAEIVVATPGTVITSSALFMRSVLASSCLDARRLTLFRPTPALRQRPRHLYLGRQGHFLCHRQSRACQQARIGPAAAGEVYARGRRPRSRPHCRGAASPVVSALIGPALNGSVACACTAWFRLLPSAGRSRRAAGKMRSSC